MFRNTLIRSLFTMPLLAGLVAPALPAAADDPDLSDAETSYKGAVILEGDWDVTLGGVDVGSVGEPDEIDTYGFFSGNTLYAGAEDDEGNTVDMIAEFFWFESSIDRGSDFYVGVIKVRNSPNQDGWELNVEDEPVIYLAADTDLSTGTGAFRWDWSLPFENYGIDSYGEATLQTSYGLGANAEGSAMVAETENEDGNTESSTVQVKGYVNADYKVSAQYQVTLWRWEVDVHGTPGSMEWEMYLNSGDRKDQNAYHEFFVVMQADEGVPFTMDWLEVGGSVTDQWWFWWDNRLSVALTDVVLQRPEIDDVEGDDDDDVAGDDDDDDAADDDDDDAVEGDDDDDHSDDIAGDGEMRGMSVRDLTGDAPELGDDDDRSVPMACATVGADAPVPTALGGLLVALGLVAALRRGRRV